MEGRQANIFNESLIREQIIKLALLQYHKLYEHGQNGPDSFDCAGFVWFIYNQILNINIYNRGFGLSTTTKIMTSSYGKLTIYEESVINKDINNIQKGDILFFHRQSMNDNKPTEFNRYPGHCGIYLENNCFIHCSRPKGKVIISNFDNNPYWKGVLVGSKNIVNDAKVLERIKI